MSEAVITVRFLNQKFLEAMNDIGRYGHEKYGALSFHHRAQNGDNSRPEGERYFAENIAGHSNEHFLMYLEGTPHDFFDTRKHQLAAVAFNAMMEFYFAGLESEQ